MRRERRVGPNRREFLHAGAVCAATAGTCLCGGGCKMISGVGDTPALAPGAYTLHRDTHRLEITLGRASDLAQAGGAVKLVDAALPESLLLASPQLGTYVAVSLGCTHGGRELEYDHGAQRFRCVSFGGSEFALDGARLAGPAERALNAYPTTLRDGRLLVSLAPDRDKVALDLRAARW